MSKRSQEFQGGGERYGMQDQSGDMSDVPKQATAAQMARRKIAQTRKPSGSQRSSRAGTPTGNVFGQQGTAQQSMASFQPPEQSGAGFGGGFSFSAGAPASNPFAQTNGSASTPPPSNNPFAAPPQSNGGGALFGNSSTSFGSTFGSGSSQAQQNGFNPSTTSFGQTQPSTSSLFSGFGPSNQSQPQPNGATPPTATTSSFPSFGKQDTGNPFKNFGQSQQQTQSTSNTSFNFGQTSQQNGEREKTPSTPFAFGQNNNQSLPNGDKPLFGSTSQAEQTPKTATSNVFSSFGQPNGDKSQSIQAPKPTPINNFSGLQNSAKGLFGSTPPPESTSSTPKPGESIFSSLNKPEGISTNMFTQKRDQTPKPSTSNIFGSTTQQPQQTTSEAEEQTPKPNNIFGSLNQSQPNGVMPNIFGSASTQKEQAPAKSTSSNLFGDTFGQQASQQSSAPTFKFGPSQQDTSMTTPGNTPQKQAGQQPAGASQISAQPTGSLFDRITPRDDPPATAQKTSFTPSTSFFNAPSAHTTSTNEESEETPADGSGENLYDQLHSRKSPVTASKPAFTPSTSSFTKPAGNTAAPWLSHASAVANELLAAQQQPAMPTAALRSTNATMDETISASEKDTLKVLNEGLRAHLTTQDANVDWTTIMQYYVQQAAKIRKKPEPKLDAADVTTSIAPASNPTGQSKPAASSNMFTPQTSTATPAAPSNNLFSSATPKASATTFQHTPRPSGAPNLLKPPQTAPVNRKRPAEDDAQQLPATEKRPRAHEPTEYPKLPANASETAKAFQAALDRSTGGGAAAFPESAADARARPVGKERKEKETEEEEIERIEKEAKERAEKEMEEKAKQSQSQSQTFGGFKPSTAGFTPSTAGFTPSASGFAPSAPSGMPSFSAPATGSGAFLAAFGKKATEQEDKDRKKRKAEDYDSDEETEEAWAARDKVEQEAKRQKYLNAAKSGAGFTPSASGTPAPESEAGDALDEELGSEGEKSVGMGKSLFDRITPRDPPATAPSKTNFFAAQTPDLSKTGSGLFGSRTPSAFDEASTGSNIFGHLSKPRASIEVSEDDKTEVEKDLGTGDNTWKPNTPIKFGASATTLESTTPAAAPPFGNLFGTLKTNTDSNGHLNVPKPTFGFNFGGQPSSLGTSRASTPGLSTDGEGASTAGDDEEDPPLNDPQVEDQTGLRESEKEEEDLLLQVRMAKAMKWDEKKNESGEIAWGWVDKGKGPLYILKNKETGKTRVVVKVPPYGVPRMNFAPLLKGEYGVSGKKGNMVNGVFVDHTDLRHPGKLTKWIVQVKEAEDAAKIAKVLMEERS